METKFYSQKELAALKSAIENQIARPARAGVNNEAAFVANSLTRAGYECISMAYWSWTCYSRKNDPIFGEEILALQQELVAIDRKHTIPAWGTYGT